MLVWLFLILTLFSNKAFSQVCEEPKSVVSLELMEELILSQPGCQSLKSYRQNKEKILRNGMSMSERQATQAQFISDFKTCQELLYKSCYPNLKNHIDEEALNKKFQQWKRNPLYKMKAAEIHCYHRAYALANDLTRQGYKTQIAKVSAASLLAFNKDEKGNPTSYYQYSSSGAGVHYVVSMEVQKSDGSTEKYFLDPQFAEAPMPESQYLKMTTGFESVTAKTYGTSVEESVPTLFFQDVTAFVMGRYKLSDSCGWHDLQKIQKEITQINLDEFNTSSPIPASLIGQSPEQISKALRLDHYKGIEKDLKKNLERAKLLLKNQEDGMIIGLSSNNINDPKFTKEQKAALQPILDRGIADSKVMIKDLEKRLNELRRLLNP